MRAPTPQGVLIRLALAAAAAYACATILRAEAGAGDRDCLVCHSDRRLTVTRDGRTLPLYADAHVVAASVHGSLGCTDCHDGVDAKARPSHGRVAPVDCRSCHEDTAKTHPFHAAFALPPKAGSSSTDCVACHSSHDTMDASGAKSVFAGPKLAASCAACHARDVERFQGSAHGAALAAGRAEAPNCLTCHAHPITSGDKLAMKREQTRLCLSCHRDQSKVLADSAVSRGFIVSYDKSVHGMSLAGGNANAATCVDCHGSHETAGALSAGSRVSLRNIIATCARCHRDEAREYAMSAHGAALRKGLSDAPACTTCHGEHQILHAKDPNSPVSLRNVSEMVCGTCHGSVKLGERYGLATDRVETFADSYHGLAARGGSVVAVNCASCHGAHAIRPSSDPLSPVNRANLAQTCGQCHAGADKRFATTPVHVNASRDNRQEPAVYWIATIYVWLIGVVLGGMILHNGLDIIRKIRRKIGIQKGTIVEEAIPHRLYLRMTVNERLQHGTLVISFVTLVVTGFMLRFPDAWWVIHIRERFANVFQWRSAIHRIAGVTLVAAGAWHFAYLAFTARGRRLFLDLLPQPKDLTDAWGILRYNTGLAPQKPKFGRFSYIEKTEYWAMMWGSIVMGITGALLWFENTSIHLFTKLGYDVSRTIHLYEAILATLAIIVWHFYFVIFNPDIYPMNLSWLTGWLSEKEMMEDHPLELERLKGEGEGASGPNEGPPGGPGPG
jgi:predicted CXXCH cytochrome family protein